MGRRKEIFYYVHGRGGNGKNMPLSSGGVADTANQCLSLPDTIVKVVHGTGQCHREAVRLLGLGDKPTTSTHYLGNGYYTPIDPALAKKTLLGWGKNTVVVGNQEFLAALGQPKAAAGSGWKIIHNRKNLRSISPLL